MPTPAFVVPDEETWMLWGKDPRDRGFEPVVDPGRADVLVVPERVPLEISSALVDAWKQMPAHRRYEPLAAPWIGLQLKDVLGGAPHNDHGGAHDHEEHEGHGDHGDHGDMMAIVGEPSRDGLVMEPISMETGPISPGLPTGLAVSASLDGDVVAECTITGVLAVPARDAAPGRQEIDRALSHLAWLHRYLRLLGMRRQQERARAVLEQALAAGEAAADAARRLADELTRSRSFASRTEGLAVLGPDEVERTGLLGPNARASGIPTDRRRDDPVYVACGFEPLIRAEGDARARALVRAGEAVQSLQLAAQLRDSDSAHASHPVVEGPRGPLRRVGEDRVLLGAAEAFQAAEAAAVGREWASALTAIASFDLSPTGPGHE